MANHKNSRATERAFRVLIGQLEDELTELKPARTLTEQKRKKRLLARLKSLADALIVERKNTSKKPTSAFLTRIVAQKLGGDEDRYTLISTADILYSFLGHALSSGLIRAPSIGQHLFRDNSIYLRTAKGVFVTHYSTLKDLRDRVDPQLFAVVHKSIFVNIQKIATVDFSRNHKQIGFAVSDVSLETVIVSRFFFKSLRPRLGLPTKARHRRAPNRRSQSIAGSDR
jgi:hypothetical protein